MKKIITIAAILILSSQLFAQGYDKNKTVLNAGIGFGLAGIYGDATLPPISLGLQFGVNEKISVGGMVGFSTSTYDLGSFLGKNYEWDYTYIIVGARGEYHFLETSDKLDAYAGLTLGYSVASVSEPSGYSGFYTAESGYFLYGVHVGARYALSNSLGVFGELGYGVGYLTAGVFFKL